jgi:LysM repeat protein
MSTNKNTYHIDVTQEEDAWFKDPVIPSQEEKKSPISFKTAFVIALVVHAIGAIALISTAQKASAKELGTEPIKTTPAAQIPVQTPTPVPKPSPDAQPVERQVSQTVSAEKVVPNNLTKVYVVKQGDSLNSIARKYKLSTQQLIKLNNITDPNKIKIGQTLKFLH